MKTNHVKMRTLPILDEILIIYITNCTFKKNHPQKSSIVQQLMAKELQNLKIFIEITAYLQKQCQKIHLKKKKLLLNSF